MSPCVMEEIFVNILKIFISLLFLNEEDPLTGCITLVLPFKTSCGGWDVPDW